MDSRGFLRALHVGLILCVTMAVQENDSLERVQAQLVLLMATIARMLTQHQNLRVIEPIRHKHAIFPCTYTVSGARMVPSSQWLSMRAGDNDSPDTCTACTLGNVLPTR